MAKQLIGLAGRAGAGKDALADHLVRRHGFVKYAMAGPLKAAAKELFRFSDQQLHGADKDRADPRYGRSPRELLQKLGTDWVRDQVSTSFWVDRFREWYAQQAPCARVVVSDVRFPNEVAAVRALGGRVLRVDRPGGIIAAAHVSEAPLYHVDAVLANDGDLARLFALGDAHIKPAGAAGGNPS